MKILYTKSKLILFKFIRADKLLNGDKSDTLLSLIIINKNYKIILL